MAKAAPPAATGKDARRAALQAEMDALDATETDDDLEVWIRRDGTETQLKGKHAKSWLNKLGLGDDDDAGEDQGDEADAGDEDPEPAKRGIRSRMFESK